MNNIVLAFVTPTGQLLYAIHFQGEISCFSTNIKQLISQSLMVLIVFSNSSSKGKEEVVYHHVWFYFCGKTRYLSLKVNSIQELASWSLREIIKSQRERKKGYIWTFAGSMVGKSFLSSPIVCSQRDAPSLDTLMPLLSSASSLTSCCTSLLHSGEPMSML